MIGRGLPRDYLDVAVALRHYDRGQLLELGFRRDPGLRVADLALAMRRFDQIPDRQFGAYGLIPDQSADARAAFRDWPREAASDVQGDRAHLQAAQPLTNEPPPPRAGQATPGTARPHDDAPPAPGTGPYGPARPEPSRGPRRSRLAPTPGWRAGGPDAPPTRAGASWRHAAIPGTGRALRPVVVAERLHELHGP